MTTEKEKFKEAEAKFKEAEAVYDAYIAAQNRIANKKFETGKDIYVPVLENPNEDYGPIVFETYLKHSSRESVEHYCKKLYKSYGKCKIAKLTFIRKTFLSLEEAKEKADYCDEYMKGVYEYELDGKITLIENGEVLIEGVDNVHWYAAGVYEYKKNDKWALIENGKVLIDGANWIDWYEEGVYSYRKDGKRTLIENGKVLIDNVDFVWREMSGVYRYEKDCKRFEVKNGITTEI